MARIAFIFHPLNRHTLAMMSGIPDRFLRLFNREWIKQALKKKQPFLLETVLGLESTLGKKLDLLFIVCPLLPEQLALEREDIVLSKISDCVRLAEDHGATIAVLAGFTSIVGNQGEQIAKKAGISVTTGNTFTAGLAIEGAQKASETLGMPLAHSRIAIIGATGDIGRACAKYFSNKVQNLSLCARTPGELNRFANEISANGSDIKICNKVEDALEGMDGVICATSALTTIIDPRKLKQGSWISDVSLPPSIARDVVQYRQDILVFEGGLCQIADYGKIKGSKMGRWFKRNSIYGCLGEGLALGFEGRNENFSIGRGNIDQAKINEITIMAHRNGIQLSEFVCGEKVYNQSDLEQVRKAKLIGSAK